MKATELRIGNLVSTPNQKVFRIDLFDYVANGIGKFGQISSPDTHPLTWYLQDLQPIPITEEKLVDLGGKKYVADGGLWFIGEGTFLFQVCENYDTICLHDPDRMVNISAEYKYVHELQNLYFALYGEELTTLIPKS